MYKPETSASQKTAVKFIAFGYSNGIPMQADLIFDTRFLPNPHYIDNLRPKTGNDPDVADYVLKNETAQKYLRLLKNMLKFLMPHFEQRQKSYITIAIGCTGGRHRSVAVTNALGAFLKRNNYPVTIDYRDVEK